MIRYRIYPSLLDAFEWYKRSEADNALQELLDKVNRVKTPPSDAMLRGVEFERVTNSISRDMEIRDEYVRPETGLFKIHDTEVSASILENVAFQVERSARQVWVEKAIRISSGEALICGMVDNTKMDWAIDTKYTGKYEFPKFLNSWQHRFYLSCLKDAGIVNFRYLVTDFKEVYCEDYIWQDSFESEIRAGVEEFGEFLDSQRAKITDRKIFGLA